MRFLFLLLMLVGGVVEAALTSSPIYAPCIADFVRTDIGVCTLSSDNPVELSATATSCHVTYIPKSRRIKLNVTVSVHSNNAVTSRELDLLIYAGNSCSGQKFVRRRIIIYEQVATINVSLFNYSFDIEQVAVDGNVALSFVSGDTGSKFVSYYALEYVDR